MLQSCLSVHKEGGGECRVTITHDVLDLTIQGPLDTGTLLYGDPQPRIPPEPSHLTLDLTVLGPTASSSISGHVQHVVTLKFSSILQNHFYYCWFFPLSFRLFLSSLSVQVR